MTEIKTAEALKKVKGQGLRRLYPEKVKITVGTATCGLATGAGKTLKAIEEEVKKAKLDAIIAQTGCLGFCQKEPIVDVFQSGKPRLIYAEITQDRVRELIQCIKKGRIKRDWVLCKLTGEEYLVEDKRIEYPTNGVTDGFKNVPLYEELPFFARQQKIALRNCGFIDPESIEQYIAKGGYSALCRVLTQMTPQKVIEKVKKSGLRGRGGAGFPTGVKWEYCRKAKGKPKYIICNADEGDPGAYMDRSILEGDPHSVIEGMLIGAYAIGAKEGYIYVRTEYPLAIERFKKALQKAKEVGLLGKNIFGTDFDFEMRIAQGAGAFVCGEETSLIASIEGNIPEPKLRPPFPAESGLFRKPTNINNVETWANVPVIITRGADWFSNIGTENSKGTKVFSLVGKVKNTGLVEVPMGITLRDIIYEIGEGILEDKKFKAVQTGGPSGGCIPGRLIDLPVDYESLAEAGSIMGSGGMVVMDEDTCVVDIAKFFLEFTKDESCGKCNACREGIDAMLKNLKKISRGEGKEEDLVFLEELGRSIQDVALCGLGQTAPNPVLSTIRHFRDEYLAHIKNKRCPAAVCKKIISSPCQHTCPLGQDVPSYIAYIARGQFDEAIDLIRKENPLPSVCGRVCHNPCEAKCKSGDGGDPVAIRALKRFAADYEFQKGMKPIEPVQPKYEEKVAIVGSGPAGLTCAHYLVQQGYRVTVFEALSVAGGMLAVGIPEYRLPKNVLNAEIEMIKNLGVEIKTNSCVGKDISFDVLHQDYQAIFIATGAHKGLTMGIPGEDVEGIIDAIAFLRDVNLGKKVNIGKRVAVVGGGNAAIDAARTALRLGCEEVTILYRRTPKEMPAYAEEVEAAIEEGIRIHYLTNPSKVMSQNGKLTSVECIRMQLGAFDNSDRRRPVPIEGSEFRICLDTMIYAIRQEPDLSFVKNNTIKISKYNTIITDPEIFTTSEPGIFAGGDAVTGPDTVTEAMKSGKIAAQSIHKYLRGDMLEREYKVTRPSVSVEPLKLTEEETEELLKLGRPEIPSLSVKERTNNLREVTLGLSKEMVVKEARRCLRCDLEN